MNYFDEETFRCLMMLLFFSFFGILFLILKNEDKIGAYFGRYVKRRIKEVTHRDGTVSYRVQVNRLFGLPLCWMLEYVPYYGAGCLASFPCIFETQGEAQEYIDKKEKFAMDNYNCLVKSSRVVKSRVVK
ncbi:MAG: hypothetical protein II453_14925 [Alphaproteobacteria bacterium]|nr:hypothetical protein [Alphaproteobacteria bacterium]